MKKLSIKKVDKVRSGGDKVTLRDNGTGKPLAHCVVSNNFSHNTHDIHVLYEQGGQALGVLITPKGAPVPESVEVA